MPVPAPEGLSLDPLDPLEPPPESVLGVDGAADPAAPFSPEPVELAAPAGSLFVEAEVPPRLSVL